MDGENGEVEGESTEMTWLRRSLGTMVHEIGHMFGLRHCIVYECTMNGSNGSFEQNSRGTSLCPVCLAKLKMNLKFDCKERFEKLVEISQKIGFHDKVARYSELLSFAT